MLTLNTTRTYKTPVVFTSLDEDGNEQTGEFNATFKIMPKAEFEGIKQEDLLDHVLVSVDDIELFDNSGKSKKKLNAKQTLQAVKDDVQLASSLVLAYIDTVVKKPKLA